MRARVARRFCPLALLTAMALLAGLPLATQATQADTTLATALQHQPRVGTARLRYWGFDVYDASLYAAPGFDIQRFQEQGFGLELHYLRRFKGTDIAERSIQEMKGLATISPAQAQRWQSTMAALFPDVEKGDRITGLHMPGRGARFYLNGVLLGDIADDTFSRQFFGIWLSPDTSQPRMRDALIQSIGAGAPRAP